MQLSNYLYHKRTIFYILLLCFLCRIILVLTVDPFGSDTVDGYDYHNHAISLLEMGEYPTHGSLPFMRPPLYPLWLAFCYSIFNHESYLTARLGNGFLDTLACFIFYKLILLVWNNKPVALISSLIYAVNPLLLFFSIRVRVEALFGLLLVSLIYTLIKNYKSGFPNAFSLIFVGLLGGLATLCRPNALLVIGLITFWIIYVNWRKWKKAFTLCACFVLGCTIIILPWTIRNYSQHNEFILVSDGFGYSFWISNSEHKMADLKAKDYQEYLEADKRLWQDTARIENTLNGKSLKEKENYYTNLGIQYIKDNFSSWLGLNIMKFIEFWSPMGRIDMQGWKSVLTLPFGLLMLLGLILYVSKFFQASFDRNIWFLFAILIVTSTIAGVMHWSSIRYRIPMVDAYLIPFSVSWFLTKLGVKANDSSL